MKRLSPLWLLGLLGIATASVVAFSFWFGGLKEPTTAKSESDSMNESQASTTDEALKGPSVASDRSEKAENNPVNAFVTESELSEVGKELKVSGKGMKPLNRAPRISVKDNPQAKLIAESYTSGTKQYRISPMIPPEPFDAKGYEQNKEAYLADFAPGRVWQAATPKEGTPAIKALTPIRQSVVQGEAIRLRVQLPAGSPITFTTFDTGFFQNELPSITLEASADNVAEAVFSTAANTNNYVNIAAASPMASGMLHYKIFVQVPQATN